jgi:hypothetical protein
VDEIKGGMNGGFGFTASFGAFRTSGIGREWHVFGLLEDIGTKAGVSCSAA